MSAPIVQDHGPIGGSGGSSGITVGTTTSNGTANTLLMTTATGKVGDASGVRQPATNQLLIGDPGNTARQVLVRDLNGNNFEAFYSGAAAVGDTTYNIALNASTTLINAPATGNLVELRIENVARLTVGNDRLVASAFITNPGNSRVAANVTNGTITPSNITGLSATLVAGRHYKGTIVLFCNQSVTADGFRIDLDGGTCTATDLRGDAVVFDSAGTRFLGQVTALATDLVDANTTGNARIVVEFLITVNAAGTLIPRFALEALSTGVATVFRGSSMVVEDIT